MEEIGWSLVINNFPGNVEYGDYLLEGVEGEVVILEPQYYMEVIRGMLGEVKFSSGIFDGILYVEAEGIGERFRGVGMDRELAFMNLLREVGQWYWMENCPSIGNLRMGDLLGEMSFEGDRGGYDFEILENEGVTEVRFSEGWIIRTLLGRWGRYFRMHRGYRERDGMVYHGLMKFLEGDFEIWSPPEPTMPSPWISYSSGGTGFVGGMNSYTVSNVGYGVGGTGGSGGLNVSSGNSSGSFLSGVEKALKLKLMTMGGVNRYKGKKGYKN